MKNYLNTIVLHNAKITASLRLNQFADDFESTEFYKKFISKAFFEFNPFQSCWEYHIEFNNKPGFIVLSENQAEPDEFMLYIYPKGDEVLRLPNILLECKDFLKEKNHEIYSSKIGNIIKTIYRSFIQKHNR
jgi:hypothetical protein